MAYRKNRTSETVTSVPGGIPSWRGVISWIKKLVKSSQYDFYETEAFQVSEVILNEPSLRGAVKGTFLNNPEQSIKGEYGLIKPLTPNFISIPLIGEHVVVVEYNKQHYWTSIINRRGKVNENAVISANEEYDLENNTYGKTFQRKNVKQLEVGEGSIMFQGRFGQSIHFDASNNNPSILIRNNKDNNVRELISEDIDDDDSSIYLTSNGLRGKFFNGQQITGKNILIKSDDVYIKGRNNVYLEGDEIFINAKKQNTIKMGDPRAIFIPTVNGEKLFELFVSLTNVLVALPQLPSANPKAIADIARGTDEILSQVKNQEFLNKQVMTADPNFKIPDLPKPPDIKIPEVPEVKIPEAPNIDEKISVNKIVIEEQLKNLKKQ